MQITIHSAINEINATDWNGLIRDNNPFLRHEFLLAAEQNDCVGEKFGWIPCHITIYDNNQLIAALPLYEKNNSYGEFVFDHSWADAYARYGMEYFPKLVSAIPYTPATGQRLFCQPGHQSTIYPLMLATIRELIGSSGLNSWHLLFGQDEEIDFFSEQSLLIRHDCQYHWFNESYQDFDHFMSQLASRKRKNIRKERNSVINQGITFRKLNGHTATSQDWHDFTAFYNRTFVEKWGMATFNQSFFEQIGLTMPDQVLLVLADLDGHCVAGALMYVSETRLYGRHWGCIEQIDNLHFETCYYQGIEFCIENGLQVFEPGAQGEHKVARGFKPVMTRSAHLLADSILLEPIRDFCNREKQGVIQYMEKLNQNLPFRNA